jgi:hypothetical protein
MAVRRLTPGECEQLQGFPDAVDRVTMSVCFDHQNGSASVALKCRRWQTDAWPADADEWMPPAETADPSSSTSQACPAPLVAAHVRLRFEDELLALRSQGKLIWSASAAVRSEKYPLPTPGVGIALSLARPVRGLALEIMAGRAESPVSIRLSTAAPSGDPSAPLSGGAMAGSAGDAASDPKPVTFTTSDLGRAIPMDGLILGTLCCSALRAIAGLIPNETLPDNFSVELTVGAPYTAIPWRKKPAEDCPDGPRYKALGNSWAVPCAAWIGARIDAQLNSIAQDMEAAV